MAAAADLVRKRAHMIGAVTKFQTFVTEIDNDTTVEDIEVRLNKLDDYYNIFYHYENSLMAMGDQTSKSDDFDAKYFDVKAKLTRALRDLQATTEKPETPTQKIPGEDVLNKTIDNLCAQQRTFFEGLREHSFTQTAQDVRLPRILIDPFSGDYSSWPSFRDLFTSSVHKNDALSDVHKFQLLKSFLKGDAAELVRHITITDLNYQQAWEKLEERYEKKKTVTSSLINKFMSQKPMTSEFKVSELRKIADTSDGVIRELKCVGSNHEKRDPWLIFIILGKLDVKTQEAWATHSVDTDSPSFEMFLQFLQKRCDAFESCTTLKTQPTRSQFSSKVPTKLTSINASTVVPNCLCCSKGNHPLYKCFKFRKLEVFKRLELVTNGKICTNCLSSQHLKRDCPSKMSCKICGKPHNTLLHPPVASNPVPLPDSNNNSSSNNSSSNNSSSINSLPSSINTSVLPASINCSSFKPSNTNVASAVNSLQNLHHSTRLPSNNYQPAIEPNTFAANDTLVPSINRKLSSINETLSPINEVSHQISKTSNSNSQAFFVQNPSFTLLPTASIMVKDSSGAYHKLRALLDSGAQSSLITERSVHLLKLSRQHGCLNINGLSSVSAGQTKGQVQLDIRPVHGESFVVHAFILNKLTASLLCSVNLKYFVFNFLYFL